MTSTEGPVRPTRQRQAIAAAMADLPDFRSAQEIHDLLCRAGQKVGLATVYRTLQLLADQGEIDAVRSEDGEFRYRACASGEHHHHLICRHCGATVEIDAPSLESLSARVAADHGFTEVSHTLEIFGSCPACS